MKRAAHWLSIALHPLFMPVCTVVLVLHLDPHLRFFVRPEHRAVLTGMVALLTVAFPLFSTLLLVRAGVVSGITLPHRQERAIPYAMTLFYYALTWYLLRRSPFTETLEPLFLGAFVALFITALVTLRWKISAHMVGIGGLVGALAGLARAHGAIHLGPLAMVILLAGALGTARLLASDHTQGQVFAGALLGFLCVFGAVAMVPW